MRDVQLGWDWRPNAEPITDHVGRAWRCCSCRASKVAVIVRSGHSEGPRIWEMLVPIGHEQSAKSVAYRVAPPTS
jgi:hypothetical protein